ncbi:hypothetical protein EFA46_015875 (plasmid) [Halarchaeum sp. CBA1220]|nr:hypothetical protein [Halarchaeum sp. CBA1220]QLC35736.1 hypothetical protein EFA46_015875 [Halarchaeum sp. CBA1220]
MGVDEDDHLGKLLEDVGNVDVRILFRSNHIGERDCGEKVYLRPGRK